MVYGRQKVILPHLTLIVKYIIYNTQGHLGHFKDFKMKEIQEELQQCKTAKMHILVLFLKYIIFRKGDENVQIFKFE